MGSVAIFGAGCFWGVEESFGKLRGVLSTEVGYAGGDRLNPSYKEVCQGDTGHAEVVRVEFDPALTSYKKLVEHFFDIHNPTTLNRQGPDTGSQYRSVIFYTDEEQAAVAREVLSQIDQSEIYRDPIVTEVTAQSNYYPAEEYHQKYFEKNPDSGCSI